MNELALGAASQDELEQRYELLEFLAGFEADPLGFVMACFPWGEPGELEDYDGPEEWQRELLTSLGNGVLSVHEAIARAQAHGEDVEARPMQHSRTSGHGIGKSACVSWIIWWAISTHEDTKGVVTANTENQLKTKTWAEVAKWHRLFIGKELFKFTATAIFSVDREHERTWRIDMVPWSERNMEAFAGLHNKGKRILIIFDEASAIPDVIWETTEGALTDKNTQIIWCVFGNPTKTTGRFRECFDGGRFAEYWEHKAIDSREVRITNHAQIARWVEAYGEDHDFVRVRVRGMFPRVDAVSFIPAAMIREAVARKVPDTNYAKVVLGVDVARYGDDASVICPRQGVDAKSRPWRRFNKLNTVQLAREVIKAFHEYDAAMVYVDEGGSGGGVIDFLELHQIPVQGVKFSGRPEGADPRIADNKHLNRRAEIWDSSKAWLAHGCLPETVGNGEQTLEEQGSTPTYTFSRGDYLQIESKRDMRRRNVPSPDDWDALAISLAYPDDDYTDDQSALQRELGIEAAQSYEEATLYGGR